MATRTQLQSLLAKALEDPGFRTALLRDGLASAGMPETALTARQARVIEVAAKIPWVRSKRPLSEPAVLELGTFPP